MSAASNMAPSTPYLTIRSCVFLIFDTCFKCQSQIVSTYLTTFNCFLGIPTVLFSTINASCRSQWPRGLRRRSAATRLLRLWVRIPLGTWMSVCCEVCMLSGRSLCDGPITRPEESYRLRCVVVCDLEKPQVWGGHSPRFGCKRHKKKNQCLLFRVTSGHAFNLGKRGDTYNYKSRGRKIKHLRFIN